MSIQYLKNALAIGSAKEAALYFDTVVPLDLLAGATERENAHSIAVQRKPEKILSSLMPNVENPASFYRGHEGIAGAFWGLVGLKKMQEEHGTARALFDLDNTYVEYISRCVRLTFDEELGAIAHAIDANTCDFESYRSRCQSMIYNGLSRIGLKTYSTWHDPFYGARHADPGGGESLGPDTVSVMLQGLDFVDADKLSWRKILAIRNDKKAHAELRDLRLFLHQDVAGLDRDTAIEKISAAVHRYQEQTRILKLETVKKSLAMVVSKEGFGLTAIGSLASLALTGVPLDPATMIPTLLAAAKGGVALNLGGGAALQFADARIERRKLDASPDSCVRYLQRVRHV